MRGYTTPPASARSAASAADGELRARSRPGGSAGRRRRRALISMFASSIVVLASASPALAAPKPHNGKGAADLILTGGQIVTMSKKRPFAKALAVADGKVVAVGSEQVVMRKRGAKTKVVDLHGKTVIPGLQDSHIHLSPLGWEMKNTAELSFAVSQADVLKAVREHIDRMDPAPGEWIRGVRWMDNKYDGGMVDRWRFDALAPDNPMWLARTNGGMAVNTKVFEKMGIHDDDPSTWPDWWLEDPPDFTPADRIIRAKRTITTVDGQTRELEVPNGTFIGAHGGSPALSLLTVRPPEPTHEEMLQSIRDGSREMLSLGVTAFVQPSGGIEDYREAYARGWLQPLRLANGYLGSFRTQSPGTVGAALDAADGAFSGNPNLEMTGVKFFADGGAQTRTAWVSEPMRNWETIDGKPNFGVQVADDALREAQYRAAADRGWDLHTHATGDRAMRQVVDLYSKIIRDKGGPGGDFRWTLEHGYLPLEPGTRVIEDMARYGIIESIQPNWNYQSGAAFMDNFGPERFARVNPVRSYMRAGVVTAAGSDYGTNHWDPWLGVYSMLTRKVMGSDHVAGPNERVKILDALRAYTINGAYAVHQDDTRGSLEVGKVADLVVLDLGDIKDLNRHPELALGMNKRILWTLVDGETAYKAEHFRP
ncbi:metal-dependent hydrolase [Mycobacterium tuberculosis]|nr:metal-dependent hydrolase [Mycobacterium tuberculosis]